MILIWISCFIVLYFRIWAELSDDNPLRVPENGLETLISSNIFCSGTESSKCVLLSPNVFFPYVPVCVTTGWGTKTVLMPTRGERTHASRQRFFTITGRVLSARGPSQWWATWAVISLWDRKATHSARLVSRRPEQSAPQTSHFFKLLNYGLLNDRLSSRKLCFVFMSKPLKPRSLYWTLMTSSTQSNV